MEHTDENQTATPLELFFDLVFVFALTQITAFMAHDADWRGLAQGLLILALLWWAWGGYAWLCNVVRADEGPVRMVLLVALTVMFMVALAIPEAFHDIAGGLHGPYVIVACYFAFRITHIALFWVFAKDDPGLRGQLLKFLPTLLISTVLLSVAAHSHDQDLQILLWSIALVVEYLGTVLGGASGWRLRSAGHFAERHGLMVIIGLGESIVAIGVGVERLPISWPIVVAATLGMALSAGLWWLYFDVTAIAAEHKLAAAASDGHQTAMARDAYSILHMPMMAGIVLLALGLKKLLGYVGDPAGHHLDDPLSAVALAALFGGVLVYVLAHIGFKRRTIGTWSLPRTTLALAIIAAWVAVGGLPGLGQLGVLTVLVWATVAYETWHYREQRRELRHAGHGHHEAGAHLPDGAH